MDRHTVLSKWTFERRLLSLVVVAVLGVVSIGWAGYRALSSVTNDISDLVHNQALLAAHQDADMMHVALRADVVTAILADDASAQREVAVEADDHADRARSDMSDAQAAVAQLGLDASDPVAVAVDAATQALDSYADRAVAMVALADTDAAGARQALPSFLDEFSSVEQTMGEVTAAIEQRAFVAQSRAKDRADDDATQTAILAVLSTALLLVVVEATRRGVRATLAATRAAEQETARISSEVRLDAERQHFKNRVHDALDMVDNESDLYTVVRRSMAATADGSPTELLLADNSHAHLRVAVDHPASGGPGCPVQSPWDCVAVRRGQTIVFESSEDVNVCPKLRDRPSGACSATCVPVTFMGRALGVLHTTGPDGAPPAADTVERLTVLATEAGTRIGTVRAFAKSQLQAATDALTGLPNRRTFEEKVGNHLYDRTAFTVVIADLDHFKQINDKHGHDAGDRALRLFARVLRSTLRTNDVAARFGGEEFAIALPDTSVDDSIAILERIRENLVLALLDGRCPAFTASFGVATSDAGDTFEEIVAIADEALFAAKEAGRDRIVVTGQHAPAPEVA